MTHPLKILTSNTYHTVFSTVFGFMDLSKYISDSTGAYNLNNLWARVELGSVNFKSTNTLLFIILGLCNAFYHSSILNQGPKIPILIFERNL